MKDIIKAKISQLYNQNRVKKYEITHEGLLRFSSVKPRAQELFIDLLNYTSNTMSLDSVIIQKTYQELNFSSFGNFHRYRKELVDRELIFCQGNCYYINPIYVNYYSRRQQEFLFGLFKLKKNIKVKMNKPRLIKVI
jgi:hypothetical protein